MEVVRTRHQLTRSVITWVIAVAAGTATMAVVAAFLRGRYADVTVNPIAQSAGFLVGAIIAWMWIREHNPYRLGFAIYVLVVLAISASIALIRLGVATG